LIKTYFRNGSGIDKKIAEMEAEMPKGSGTFYKIYIGLLLCRIVRDELSRRIARTELSSVELSGNHL